MANARSVKRLGVVLLVAAVAVLTVMVSSVAYAAWYSNHELDTSATAGVTHVTINQPFMVTWSNGYVTSDVAVDIPTQVAHMNVYNLGPGDYCIMGVKVKNTGTLPVLLGIDVMSSPEVAVATTSGFYFFNTLSNPTGVSIGPAMNGITYNFPVVSNYGVTLNGGESTMVYFALGLYADAPQTLAGTGISVSYMITGMTPGGNGP